MRLRTALIATISAGVIGALGLASPAAAAAPPTIVSPTNGSIVPYGEPVLFVIDAPTAGNYFLSVDCLKAGTSTFKDSGNYDLVVGSNTFHVNADDFATAEVGSVCTFITYLSPDAKAQSTFTVAGPPVLELSEFSFSKTSFYPLVRDDYRDEVKYTVAVNRSADSSLTFTDAKGHVVYSDSVRLPYASTFEGTWDGRTKSGKPVLPGKYRATMTVTTDGVTVSKSDTVSVLTKMATRRLTLTKSGTKGSESSRGKCGYDYDFKNNSTTLNCQGGEYAASTYSFKIPANATNIRWNADTSHTADDFSSRGVITKRGQRVSATKYEVRVQVTGYRATIVNGVTVIYTARVKI
jgi:hypothetical protein